tara:strand:+ start:251 stop:466 length:216 start_codon:yes stop_codon:yes gene_type:complete
MNKNKCLVCGSLSFIADRALSGRLICTSCGNPYGVRVGRNNQKNKFNSYSLNKRYMFFIIIFILALLLVII